MEQVLEFAANHALLAGGFVAVLLLLLWTEFTQRVQGFKTLSPAQAVAFINQEGAAVIDISASADFAKGHIIGATNLPASRLAEPDKNLSKLLSKPLLVVCKSGQTAAQSAQRLLKHGAKDVAVLKGGMSQWVADQYPVTGP